MVNALMADHASASHRNRLMPLSKSVQRIRPSAARRTVARSSLKFLGARASVVGGIFGNFAVYSFVY
jgi:hypothetical protein